MKDIKALISPNNNLSFFDRVTMLWKGVPYVNTEEITKELKKGKKTRLSDKLNQERKFRAELDMESFNLSVERSEDPDQPTHQDLLAYYKRTYKDLHIKSQVRTANFKVMSYPWAIVDKKTKKIDHERTEFMQKEWFENLNKEALMTEYSGHVLVEFGEMTESENTTLAPYEFSTVKRFDPNFVVPERGEVIFNTSDIKGFPYREWKKELFLLERGTTYVDGLFNECTKHAIYKAFSFADWSRSGEKWGDPLTTIRSASDNEDENDKKETAARNMGNNGYMILDIDDEIELLERNSRDAYKIWSEFIKVNNEEISKGINLQTSMSDEKAFSGSAEVHEGLFHDASYTRLRSLFYFHNSQTLPFMNFHGYNYEGYMWMPLVFLPQEKEGKKENPTPEEEDEKKKPQPTGLSLIPLVDALYEDCGCGHDHSPSNEYRAIVDLDKEAERIARSIYDKKFKGGEVDFELWKKTTDSLWSGVKEGIQDWEKNPFGSDAHVKSLMMRYNVAVTAAFKNHHNTFEITSKLFDENGKIRPWKDFRNEVMKVNDKYNRRWLRTEYNLATGQAANAAKWIDIQNRKKVLPYLQYKTQLDGNVRPAHQVLHNVVAHVDDPFWDTYMPKNDWECRCYTLQKATGNPNVPKDLPELKPMFRHNPGKTNKVFTEDHPYFEVEKGFVKRAKRNFDLKDFPINPQQISYNAALFKRYEKMPDYKLEKVDNLSGGFMYTHKDYDKDDYIENRVSGLFLAEKGNSVIIRKHSKTGKNPEFYINGKTSDLKTPNPKEYTSIASSVKNQFKKAVEQGLDNAVINIQKNSETPEDIAKGLKSGFTLNPKIRWVHLIYRDEVYKITWEQADKGLILKELKK